MEDTTTDSQKGQLALSESHDLSINKPVVVGIYAIPASGKTHLANELRKELGDKLFKFYESSEVLAHVTPNGLDAFKKLDDSMKVRYREEAIDTVRTDCIDHKRAGIVTGHFSFWFTDKEEKVVITGADLRTYTHILYLRAPAETVAERVERDTKRKDRHILAPKDLEKWQQCEINRLRDLCYDHDILLSVVTEAEPSPKTIAKLLLDFRNHSEESNMSQARSAFGKKFYSSQGLLETLLVMDGDKTLAAEDTGAIFWQKVACSSGSRFKESPLDEVSSSAMGYSYTAFRQAALLHGEATDDKHFEDCCRKAATEVTLYPEFRKLLQVVGEKDHVGTIVVPCGLRRVWEIVIENEGLTRFVKVIGNGRNADELVITAAVKAAVVAHAQEAHKLYIWAFGDGPLDIEMMKKADKAIVVVGKEETRSKSMDAVLTAAIEREGLKVSQALLPDTVPPRLNTTKLPLVQLTAPEFVSTIIQYRSASSHPDQPHKLDIHIARTGNTVNLLATPMCDANVSGPALREAHRRVGWYLATEFLVNVIGTEECPVEHVKFGKAVGYQLFHEAQTLIVALMRGGEPMAFGVNDAFPKAMFFHAKDPEDLKPKHIQGCVTLVLVDSVINTGKSIVDFVKRVRQLHATIRIVVVAGVVQDQCLSDGSKLSKGLAPYARVSVIALRTSETSFVGSRATDTGNRLFNTTHLD